MDCGVQLSEIDKANITGKYILIGQTPVPEPDLLTWAMWFEENRDARIMKKTHIGPTKISTVFLALDYGWGPEPHEPLLFETMIFTDDKAEDYCERCSTWLEAEAQHAKAVEMVIDRTVESIG